MCGIVGGFWRNPDACLGDRMYGALATIRHRGPDDHGCEIIRTGRGFVALGQTRLSIIDLSSAGHQPMMSEDSRYAIVFNGEIYNYQELRAELVSAGHRFLTATDTEVLLHAWMQWGELCLKRLEGMFAFVVYDNYENKLSCVRDPFGIKPFFYANEPGEFVFGSEKQAVITLLGSKPQVDWQRSYDYLIHGDYDSQERTFTEGIFHLMPAHLMILDLDSGRLIGPRRWWEPSVVQVGCLSFVEAAEMVRERFLDNVHKHMRSDVPLGAALSGGIDSSAVVCAMRRLEPEAPIHTFSFIAADSEVSEEKWVDRINKHVGAIEHKVIATGKELVEDLEDMICAQGEPFGSTSIYAQYRVFRLAKEAGITVMLDGQGADELLAGYSGYPGQRLLSFLETGSPLQAWRFARHWSQWPGRKFTHSWMYLAQILMPEKLNRNARRLLGRDFAPNWLNVDMLSEAGVKIRESLAPTHGSAKGRRVIERMRNSLQGRGLPALLRHADRNSMRFSIESRVPFLTVALAELLYSLPESYLISEKGETKSIFRLAMEDIVPHNVLNRRDKIGFATPENVWITGVMPSLLERLKDEVEIPFLNMEAVFKHLSQSRYAKIAEAWRLVNYLFWYRAGGGVL